MKSKKKSYFKILLITLTILVILVGWVGFSDRGLIKLYRMEIERQTYIDKIEALKRENQKLTREIYRLRHDPEYVERLAREELGLVKEDEIIYRFKTLDEPVEKKEDRGIKDNPMGKNGLKGR